MDIGKKVKQEIKKCEQVSRKRNCSACPPQSRGYREYRGENVDLKRWPPNLRVEEINGYVYITDYNQK